MAEVILNPGEPHHVQADRLLRLAGERGYGPHEVFWEPAGARYHVPDDVAEAFLGDVQPGDIAVPAADDSADDEAEDEADDEVDDSAEDQADDQAAAAENPAPKRRGGRPRKAQPSSKNEGGTPPGEE